MGSFGEFRSFCRDATLPVCNLLSPTYNQSGPWDNDNSCRLNGISLNGGEHLANLGSIIVCALAIGVAGFLLWKSDRKRAAVGRREMQMFLLGYILISICEVFSVGGFPFNDTARVAFTAVHIGAIIATTWILMLNAVVGYQLIDDGTPMSIALFVISGGVLLIGTGYIALDTGLNFTGFWESSRDLTGENKNTALYVLYQLIPLIFLVAYFVLEAVLVIHVLREIRPMIYLSAAVVLFAAGQVFNYVVSKYICDGTSGAIDGAFFETLLTLLAVVMVWIFWASITEDDWPMPVSSPYP